MKTKHALFAALLPLALAVLDITAYAQAPESSSVTPTQAAEEPAGIMLPIYTEKGADTCIECHGEDGEYPVFEIFKTKHGQPGDKRSPFAGRQCEACHGPGIIKAHEPAEDRNRMCLDCHQNKNRIGWRGSEHQASDVACAKCHTIHAAQDPVLSTSTQADVCYACHKKQRADFFKPSTHPVRFGQMACSKCHRPHGSSMPALLAKPTVNQTCYTCHAEKRGPFLWEHAPVSENCTLCHTPHGSMHSALLKKPSPLLCQQCHSQNGHPAIPRTGDALPAGSPSGFLLVRGCANCHSQVHGSNHPSGVKLMR